MTGHEHQPEHGSQRDAQTLPPAVDGPITQVAILQLPVPLYARAQQHSDDLMREFVLVADQISAAQRDQDGSPVRTLPARLVAIVAALSEGYGAFTGEQEARLTAAIDAGQAEIVELVYRVPASAAEAARQLGDMLDEADDYCRAGQHLLTLATPPDLVAFRRWFLGEFHRQVAGGQPLPWPQFSRD